MNIEELLSSHLSRSFVDHLVESIIEQPPLFDQLYPLVFSDNTKAAWRAAWVLAHLQIKIPTLFDDKIPEIIRFIPLAKHDGIKRSLIYIVSNANINDYPVDFINLCFDWMLSPKQAPAIQVYCMRTLYRVCKIYPDFRPELQACLDNVEQADYSNGFNAARRNMLKQLHKDKITIFFKTDFP